MSAVRRECPWDPIAIEYPNVDSGSLNRIWSAVPFAKPFFRKQCRDEDHRRRVASLTGVGGKGGRQRNAERACSGSVHIFFFSPVFRTSREEKSVQWGSPRLRRRIGARSGYSTHYPNTQFRRLYQPLHVQTRT